MSDVLEQCSMVGQPDGTLADTAGLLASLIQRVEALERRLVRRRPDTTARRMTRPDKCPFGWKPNPKNLAVLVEEPMEQKAIGKLVELAQDPRASYREIARRADAIGLKRRGGKPWVGSHSLVRAVLHREGILTHDDARAAVQRRIEEMKRRAGLSGDN